MFIDETKGPREGQEASASPISYEAISGFIFTVDAVSKSLRRFESRMLSDNFLREKTETFIEHHRK